jgi:hypothetical protein
LLINLGEAEDQRFELFEPEGREALDLSKNVLDQAKRDLGNSLILADPL